MADDPNMPEKPLGEDDIFESDDQYGIDMADDFDDVDLEPALDYDADAAYQDISDVPAEDSEVFDAAADSDDFSFENFDEDLDGFAEEWDEGAEGAAAAPAAQKKTLGNMGALAGGGNKTLLTYAMAGGAGLIAIAGVYFFLLGGSSAPAPAPAPAQEQMAAAQPADNTKLAQQAVSPTQPQKETSLFDSLNSLPAPTVEADLVKKNEEKNRDPNADIFSIVDSSDKAAKPADSALPMPAPISTAGDSGGPSFMPADNPLASGPTATDTAPATPASSGADDNIFALVDGPDAAAPAQPATPAPATGMDMLAAPADDAMMMPDLGAPEDKASLDVMPMETAAPAPETMAPAVMPDRAADRAAATAASDTSDLQGQINALNARMDMLDQKMDDLKSSGGGQDLSRIESTLARLEKRIEDLADRPAPAARASASASDSAPARAKSSPVRKASVSKKSKPAAPKVSTGSWSLRGASPGEALISKKGNAASIHTVRVGDSVAGLGTVQYIGIESGRWVVRTTGGTLSQ